MKFLVKIIDKYLYGETLVNLLEEKGFKFRLKKTKEEFDKEREERFASAIQVSGIGFTARDIYEIIGLVEMDLIEIENICKECGFDTCLINWKEKEVSIAFDNNYDLSDDCDDDD